MDTQIIPPQTTAPLPRLPLYDPSLHPYYKVIQPYLPTTADDQLYTTLRNIMLCLVAHRHGEMLAEVGKLGSLDEVYGFIERTPLDWEVIFGKLGKLDDNLVAFINVFPRDVGPIQITEVHQAYPRSREGGLSPQLIRMSDIVALQHESSAKFDDEDGQQGYQTLVEILDSGELKVSDRIDQFPAVYFTMDLGHPSAQHRIWANPIEDNVVFIFSTALLKSPSWHTNGGVLYGRVDESSYDPTTFHKFLFCNTLNAGEVAIHHSCPLDYLEAIVAPDTQVDEVRSVVNSRPIKYPVITASEYHNGPYTRYLKGINQPLSFTAPPLSLAWYAFSEGGHYASLETIRKTLINFGLTVQEVTGVIREYPMASLLEYLRKLNGITPRLVAPVVVHPPY